MNEGVKSVIPEPSGKNDNLRDWLEKRRGECLREKKEHMDPIARASKGGRAGAFAEVINRLDSRKPPVALPASALIQNPKVYSKRKGAEPLPEDAIYVGGGTPWGNPWEMENEAQRDEVCDKFEEYAYDRFAEDADWLLPLSGRNLVCWCAPKRCHADTLLRLANMSKVGYDVTP